MGSKDCSWTHRIPKSVLENEKDFYITPLISIFPLLDFMKGSFDKDVRILDFASGTGNFKKVLGTHFTNITEIDLYIKEPYIDFLNYEPEEKFSVILGNPPYKSKFKFIDKARTLADVVIVLLTAQSESYKIISEQYKDIPEYYGKITCYPKFFMSQDEEENGGAVFGGTTNYTYLIWIKGHNNPVKFEMMSDIRKYEEAARKLLHE